MYVSKYLETKIQKQEENTEGFCLGFVLHRKVHSVDLKLCLLPLRNHSISRYSDGSHHGPLCDLFRKLGIILKRGIHERPIPRYQLLAE